MVTHTSNSVTGEAKAELQGSPSYILRLPLMKPSMPGVVEHTFSPSTYEA